MHFDRHDNENLINHKEFMFLVIFKTISGKEDIGKFDMKFWADEYVRELKRNSLVQQESIKLFEQIKGIL